MDAMMESVKDVIDRQRRMIDGLKAEIERLKAAIRHHRDQSGDERCWIDDMKLYAAIDEGIPEVVLPPKCEFLRSCERYWEQRQGPAGRRESRPDEMTIGQLEREVERLRAAPRAPAAIVFECEDRSFPRPVTSVMSTVAHAFERMEDVSWISPWIFRVDSWTWHPAGSIVVLPPPPWDRRDFRGVPTPAEGPDPPIDWSQPGAGT